MPIPVTCPKCGATGHLPDEAIGSRIACPLCQAVFDPPARAIPPGPTRTDSSPDLGVWVDPGANPPIPTAIPAPQIAASSPQSLTSEDPGGLAEWARQEKTRFDAYVRQRLADLETTRRRLAEAESQAETRAVTRDVELNRRQAGLVARAAELDRREAELARATEALATREATLAEVAADVTNRQEGIAELETRRLALEREVADLGRLASDLRPMVERLEVRKAEAEAIRTDLAAKHSTLDRRMVEVGRTEVALQRRLDELDDLEQTLRSELEVRERELERQRVDLEEELKAARRRVGPSEPTPPPMVWSEEDESETPAQ
jgi:DNA repair exonuclease SbcCD ATPase subunit